MREAMASAHVGDDGYGEDPSVNELEARYASLVGKDAALFVPSGVMANQIALRVLAQPGDVVVAGRSQHVVGFEMGAASRNAAIQFATLDDSLGTLNVADVLEVIDSEADHQPHVSLVCVENTHMASGGVPWDVAELRALADALGDRPLYQDGARLFNAVVATGTSAVEFCAPSVMVTSCLSKGLVPSRWSFLARRRDQRASSSERARRSRKRSGWRDALKEIRAAAGLVALDTMVERLSEDHARARALAEVFAVAFPESGFDPTSCRTNIVAFDHPRARDVVAGLAALGVEGGTVSPRRARFVTHAGISDDDVEFVASVLKDFTLSSR